MKSPSTLIGAFLSIPALLCAATFTVNSLSDDGTPGTLRRTINDAANGDVINCSVTGMIVLANGQLLLAKHLTIVGPGATNLALSGNHVSRVFMVSSNVSATITGLMIRDGHAPEGGLPYGPAGESGGGIFNFGRLTLTGCIVVTNQSGSGITGGHGGGIFNGGSLTMTGCTVASNQCRYYGGNGGGIFNSGSLIMSACTVSENSGTVGSTNGGSNGGGIFNSGALKLTASTISGNIAGQGAGSASPDTPLAGGAGGGIYNSGALALTSCTVSSNSAGIGGSLTGTWSMPGGKGGSGGGIYNVGMMTIIATTIAGNQAGQGGISAASCGPRCFTHGPGGAGGDGGGIFNAANAASATLRSSLIGLNVVGSGGIGNPAGTSGVDPDFGGAFTDQGNNLIGGKPKLGPLANNGGATLTMALLNGSPALDAGDDTLTSSITTDQRGFPRKSCARVDIGAFELLTAGTPPVLLNPTQLANGAFQFSVIYSPGTSFTVFAATNISWPSSNWTLLGPPTEIGSGDYRFIDPGAKTNAHRFYSVRMP